MVSCQFWLQILCNWLYNKLPSSSKKLVKVQLLLTSKKVNNRLKGHPSKYHLGRCQINRRRKKHPHLLLFSNPPGWLPLCQLLAKHLKKTKTSCMETNRKLVPKLSHRGANKVIKLQLLPKKLQMYSLSLHSRKGGDLLRRFSVGINRNLLSRSQLLYSEQMHSALTTRP